MTYEELEQRVNIFTSKKDLFNKEEMIDLAKRVVEEITGTPVIKTSYYAPYLYQTEILAAMKVHGPMVYRRENGRYCAIVSIGKSDVFTQYDESYTFTDMFVLFTWQDGTPFGIKVTDEEPINK